MILLYSFNMKLVILSFFLSLSWHPCQVAAVQVLVALLYRTVLCCTVPYCILVFVLNFCMSVVNCMHIVALHYLFYPSVCLWGMSVCLPVSSFVCLLQPYLSISLNPFFSTFVTFSCLSIQPSFLASLIEKVRILC